LWGDDSKKKDAPRDLIKEAQEAAEKGADEIKKTAEEGGEKA